MKIKNKIEKLFIGGLILASLNIKDVVEIIRIWNKKENKPEIEVHEIDFNKLNPEVQDWIKRCYNKKNGIEA